MFGIFVSESMKVSILLTSVALPWRTLPTNYGKWGHFRMFLDRSTIRPLQTKSLRKNQLLGLKFSTSGSLQNLSPKKQIYSLNQEEICKKHVFSKVTSIISTLHVGFQSLSASSSSRTFHKSTGSGAVRSWRCPSKSNNDICSQCSHKRGHHAWQFFSITACLEMTAP